MTQGTKRALLWTAGVLTGLGFLGMLLNGGSLLDIISLPIVFGIWYLILFAVFCLGSWLRRRATTQRARPNDGDDG